MVEMIGEKGRRYYEEDLAHIVRCGVDYEPLYHQCVLVTGASGLIGSVIVDTLLWLNDHKNANIKVVAWSRNERILSQKWGERNDVTIVAQDICEEIKDCAWRADYIIHGASKGDPSSFAADPVGVMNSNYIGTLQMLSLAKKCKSKKLVFISTGETYGIVENVSENGIVETESGYLDRLNPRNCYAVSKRAAEGLLISYFKEYGVPVGIARLCHTYGGNILPDESRVIFQFMKNALAGQDIVMKSSGCARRSYCYVADAVCGIFIILLKGQAGEAYNVANPQSVVTIRNLAELIAEKNGKSVFIQCEEQECNTMDSGIRQAYFDISKLKKLGFCPRYGIEEGIMRSMEMMTC